MPPTSPLSPRLIRRLSAVTLGTAAVASLSAAVGAYAQPHTASAPARVAHIAQGAAPAAVRAVTATSPTVTTLKGAHVGVVTTRRAADGWSAIRVTFDGTLDDGHTYRAGDVIAFGVPDDVIPPTVTLNDILDASGERVATMRLHNGVIELQFTNYVRTHTQVSFSGFADMSLDPGSVTPGESVALTWTVDGVALPTSTVTAGPCTWCSSLPTGAGKWAVLKSADGTDYVLSGIQTAVISGNGWRPRMVDHIGAGQKCVSVDIFAAGGISAGGSYTGLRWLGKGRCGDGANLNSTEYAVVTPSDYLATPKSGEFLVWLVRADVTDTSLTSYSDTATIGYGTDASITVTEGAKRYTSGGVGTGSLPPVVTGSPTPSETPSTGTPSETSSTGTPSETSSTGTPSETSSTTTPAETSSTGTPSETSSETSSDPSDPSSSSTPPLATGSSAPTHSVTAASVSSTTPPTSSATGTATPTSSATSVTSTGTPTSSGTSTRPASSDPSLSLVQTGVPGSGGSASGWMAIAGTLLLSGSGGSLLLYSKMSSRRASVRKGEHV